MTDNASLPTFYAPDDSGDFQIVSIQEGIAFLVELLELKFIGESDNRHINAKLVPEFCRLGYGIDEAWALQDLLRHLGLLIPTRHHDHGHAEHFLARFDATTIKSQPTELFELIWTNIQQEGSDRAELKQLRQVKVRPRAGTEWI